MNENDDLKRALESWQAPSPGRALDYRVLASYRGELLNAPWWRRVLAARISLPVPVAMALLVAIFVTLAWRERSQVSTTRPGLQSAAAPPCSDRLMQAPDAQSVLAGSAKGASYITVGDFSGYRPVKDPTIVIETKGGKR